MTFWGASACVASGQTGQNASGLVNRPAWAAHRSIHFIPPAHTPARGKLGRRCDARGYCPTPPLLWRGGSVQHSPSLFLIYWGANWNTSGASLHGQISGFFSSLGSSSATWQKIMTQYYDGSGYISANPTVAADYVDTRVAAPTNVDDAAIRSEITTAVSANGWRASTNAQFIVLTAPGTTYAAGFDTGFCAYHSVTTVSGISASYSIDPYAGDEPFHAGCAGYDPQGNVGHVTSMLASHEYSESATDPFINAWLTSDGYEIADICTSGDDQLPNGYWVQGLWDNHLAACVLTDQFPFPGAEAPHAGFADQAYNRSLTDWSFTPTAGWQQTFSFGDPVAAGTSPSAVTANGTTHVLFVDAADNGSLTDWFWNPSYGRQQQPLFQDAAASGTSPTTVNWNQTPHAFFVDANDNNTISHWGWSLSSGWTLERFYGHRVAAGTSPSAVIWGGVPHVFYVDASDNNTITDWSWNSTTGWQQTFFYGHQVAAGTSPSAVIWGGVPHVFYVDASDNNTITDWSWNSTTGWQQTFLYGHPVMSRSSPSAMTTNDGILNVFYADSSNSNSMTAWTRNATSPWLQAFLFGHPLAAGTSPSAVVASGTPHVFYVDASDNNTITDWSWNSITGWQQTFLYGHPVASGSPGGW
jgi:hypothetical protein